MRISDWSSDVCSSDLHDDAALRAALHAQSVDDATIRTVIRRAPQRHGIVPCPHTATGLHLLETLRAEGDARPWAVVATAHPAKFEAIVEPLARRQVPPPPALAAGLSRPAAAEPPAVDYCALSTGEPRDGTECVVAGRRRGTPATQKK